MPGRKAKEEKKVTPKYKEYISLQEFNERKKVWSEYLAKTPATRAYERYLEMREAIQKNDLGTVHTLMQECRQALEDQSWELIQPPYPNPIIERRYNRLGIKEWDLSQEEDPFAVL